MTVNIMAALLLDAIFGDPKGIPHPVVYTGHIISFWENIFYRASGKGRGVVFCVAVLLSVGLAVTLILNITEVVSEYLRSAAEIYLLYSAIAFKSLKDESLPVAAALFNKDLPAARTYLSYIVGRDTDRLDEQGIVRGTVETIAESYIDGIVSVLFYMLAGAFVGNAVLFAWLYKVVNTMDSMVGYDDARYHDFGWAAAKLDDALNFIPARVGALLAICAAGFAGFDTREGMRIFMRDRKKHKSPNSAHAESAFAGLIGISLGGGAYYGGEFEARPALGDDRRTPVPADILSAHKILTLSVVMCAVIIFITGVVAR